MDTESAWDFLIEEGMANEGELALITNINGYSIETLEAVLYARAGCHSFEEVQDEQ